MASTTSKIVERIRIETNTLGDGSSLSDDKIISIGINPIVRDIAAAALAVSKTGTIVTVGGTSAYSLPANNFPLYKASYVTWTKSGSSPKRLEWIVDSDLKRVIDEEGQGEPRYWTLWNDKFVVAPVPSSSGDTFTIDAWGGPPPAAETAPALTTDELGLSLDVEDAVVHGSAMKISALEKEAERLQFHAEMYKRKIELIRQRLSPATDFPASIQDSFNDRAIFVSY